MADSGFRGAPTRPPVLQRARVSRRLWTSRVKGSIQTHICMVDPETEKKCYQTFVERCAPQSTQSTISTIHNPMYEYLCSGVHDNPPTRVQAGAKGALHYSSGECCKFWMKPCFLYHLIADAWKIILLRYTNCRRRSVQQLTSKNVIRSATKSAIQVHLVDSKYYWNIYYLC